MTATTVQILLWVLAFSMLAFLIAAVFGLEFSRRRYAEEKADYLHNLFEKGTIPYQQRQLEEMRSVLNNAHRRILAVTKSEKLAR